MKRTLLLAAATMALMAAPAQAQLTDTDAGKSLSTPHRSSASGLPTDSPQVDTMQRGDSRVYSGSSSGTRSGNAVGNDRMDSRSTTSTVGSGSVVDTTSSVQGGRVQTQSGQPNDPSWARQNNPPVGTYGSTTRTDTYNSGSTGYTGSTSGMGSGSMSRDDITARRGRGQNDLELSQTSLLNEFSAQGFTAVRDFRKNGQNYVANVQDQQGRWMTVEMDPRTGVITPVR